MNVMLAHIYDANHLAARLAFADFLSETAELDVADRGAWRRVEAAWARLSGRLDAHGFHEDLHIRPMLQIAAPNLARKLDAQHQSLERLSRQIDEELAALRGIDDMVELRRAAVTVLRSFLGFLTEYGQHLMDEDALAMPALADHFHPTALFAARRALLMTIACEEQWMSAAPPCASPEGARLAQAARLSTRAFLDAARLEFAARLARIATSPAPKLRRAA